MYAKLTIAVWMLLASQHVSGQDSTPYTGDDQDCCTIKKQNEDIYDLVTLSSEETAGKGCKDDCVYQKRADGTRYCFKYGGLPTECLYANHLSSSAGTMTPDAAMTTLTTMTTLPTMTTTITSATSTTLDPACGTFTSATHDGIEYAFGSGKVSWFKAKSCCTNKGAKLAKARTSEQLTFLGSLYAGQLFVNPWVDGKGDYTGDKVADRDTWVDSDGGKVPESLWSAAHPMYTGCMYLTGFLVLAGNFGCDADLNYICEY